MTYSADHNRDLASGRERKDDAKNGVLCPCIDMPRHFRVVPDVHVLKLNLSVTKIITGYRHCDCVCSNLFPYAHHKSKQKTITTPLPFTH